MPCLDLVPRDSSGDAIARADMARHPAVTFDLKTGAVQIDDPDGVSVPAIPSPKMEYQNMAPSLAHFSGGPGRKEKKATTNIFEDGMAEIAAWEASTLSTTTWNEILVLYRERHKEIHEFADEMLSQYNDRKKAARIAGDPIPILPHIKFTVGGVAISEHPVVLKFYRYRMKKTQKGHVIVDPILGVEGVVPQKSPVNTRYQCKLGPNLSDNHYNAQKWGYRQNEQMPLTREGILLANEFFNTLRDEPLGRDKDGKPLIHLVAWTSQGVGDEDTVSLFGCSSESELVNVAAKIKARYKVSDIGRGEDGDCQTHVLLFRKQNARMRVLSYDTVQRSTLQTNLIAAAHRFKGLPLWLLMHASCPLRGKKREVSSRVMTRWIQRVVHRTPIMEDEIAFIARDYVSYILRHLDENSTWNKQDVIRERYVHKAQRAILEDYMDDNKIEVKEDHIAFMMGEALASACHIAYRVHNSSRSRALESRFFKRIIQHPDAIGALNVAVKTMLNSASARGVMSPAFYNQSMSELMDRMKKDGFPTKRLKDMDLVLYTLGFCTTQDRINQKAAEKREAAASSGE